MFWQGAASFALSFLKIHSLGRGASEFNSRMKGGKEASRTGGCPLRSHSERCSGTCSNYDDRQWQSWPTNSNQPAAPLALWVRLIDTGCCWELLGESWVSISQKAEVVFSVLFLLCTVISSPVSFAIFIFSFGFYSRCCLPIIDSTSCAVKLENKPLLTLREKECLGGKCPGSVK